MERALKRERDLYSDLANALPSGIYRLRVFPVVSLQEEKWTSSKDSPYVFEFFNDRCCEILNLDRQTLEKNPGIISDLVYEGDKEEFSRRNVEANLNITPFVWEGRFKIDETLIWIHFESIPRLMENGDIIWTGILIDVSERKRGEMEINLKNQELQKLNSQKDKFFSIIAHDLKSPFNSIIGLCEYLVEQVKEKNYDGVEKFANIILHSSKRAMDLLNNLMVWVQSQTGRILFNPEYFEIVTLNNEVSLLLNLTARQKSITIVNKLPPHLIIFADKEMIGTILRNLISNAIKFSKPGGNITISAVEKQNELILSVSDQGVGIAQERMKTLFDLSESYSTSGTQNEKGTGLGLLICNEFAEKNNGKLWVESQVGIGSTFYFSLPLTNVKMESGDALTN